MSGSLRLLLADDHEPTREAVKGALEEQGWTVVAALGSGPEAVDAARRLRPHACLLDIHMPGGGIAAAADIAAELPDTAIVMLTASEEDADLLDALRAGAAGYLVKGMDLDRIGSALESVLAGESVLPRRLLRQVAQAFQPTSRRRFALPGRRTPVELTEREAEVLDLMSEGMTTEQMADRLFVAPVTVRTHVAAILRKLQVRDRAAAVSLSSQRSDPPR